MSTALESPSVAAAEKKKRRKDKADKKDGSNKRKRDSEQHEAEPETEPPSSKKRKKSKTPKKPDELQPVAVPESTPRTGIDSPKKSKKDKSQPRTSKDPKEELLIKHSPFSRQTTSFYLPLSPCASAFPLQGLCAEHLSPLLLTYYPPLQGIVLAYENARMSTDRPDVKEKAANPPSDSKEVYAKSIDEYGVTFIWLTAEFILFRPRKGTWIEGFVTLQNESLLGLVCYNYFNAVIEREKLPQDWKWVDLNGEADPFQASPKKRKQKFGESGGYFVDGKGVEVEGRILFRVEDFEASAGVDGSGGSVSIVGTMLPDRNKT